MEKIYKIFVTVPESHTDILIDEMSKAGAGIVGNYTHCAFITKGLGNYKPSESANPFIGEIGKINREPEDKVEMILPKNKLDDVIKVIKKVHPYETPTIDVVEILFFS